MKSIYFDNAASTKVDPRVFEAMKPYFCESYANASALHSPAQEAKVAVEKARESVCELLGADDPSEIIFTSGATEGNDTVLFSFDGTMLVSAIEHPSVYIPACESGRAFFIPVDESGTLILDEYKRMLEIHKPQLVSVMLVNNEIGSVQDIDTIGAMAHEAGAKFHSDMTQGIGKYPANVSARPIDYATLSGHKIHAPKGIGALWVRTGAPLKRFMVGGTHEAGRRSGTLNVPGIVGLGEAARIILQEKDEHERLRRMKRRIVRAVLDSIPDVKINGQENGAPHILSISFFRTEGESIIINLDAQGICVTAGSACSSGGNKKSHVLTAIGLPDEWLRGTVRVSLGRFNTEDEVDSLIEALIGCVQSVRSLSGYVGA